MNNNRLMRIENLVVNCTARYPRTCRRTPFEVVVYELNYSSEDKELMDLLRTKAEELARQVNPGAANNSMHERSPERILADCISRSCIGIFLETLFEFRRECRIRNRI